MAVRAAEDRFIATWGQMGAAWGISRTMAEVHALLYITAQPMNTDDIMERLQISRGNASMSLRSLLDWGIVLRTHKRGDRKEYFQADTDVWSMFRAIVRERMKREVDPLLASLHEIRDLTAPGTDKAAEKRALAALPADERAALQEHHARLDAMIGFFQTVDGMSRQFVSPAGRGLQAAATVLARII
jgi:HTH-type transcriptional regulator, glycine betaine synthesis regulator